MYDLKYVWKYCIILVKYRFQKKINQEQVRILASLYTKKSLDVTIPTISLTNKYKASPYTWYDAR